MKRILFIVLVQLAFVTTQAQGKKFNPSKPPLVQSTNWEEMSLFFANNFFDGKEDEILKQISKEELEAVKKYNANWPAQMQFDTRFASDVVARAEYNKKLSKLKMYKIATFKHVMEGTDWGNYVIVRVPYKENINWDSAARWEGNVYFIFPEKVIVEMP